MVGGGLGVVVGGSSCGVTPGGLVGVIGVQGGKLNKLV